MAKKVHLLGQLCSGHVPYPARVSTSGSDTVFVNGKAVHREEDSWAEHEKGGKNPNPHFGTLASGSGTVKVNGKGMARVGDPINTGCSSTAAGGSSTVFCGD